MFKVSGPLGYVSVIVLPNYYISKCTKIISNMKVSALDTMTCNHYRGTRHGFNFLFQLSDINITPYFLLLLSTVYE
jgi:hypothetical protein